MEISGTGWVCIGLIGMTLFGTIPTAVKVYTDSQVKIATIQAAGKCGISPVPAPVIVTPSQNLTKPQSQ